MSQETACGLTSSSSSIPLVIKPVSPCQVINTDVSNTYPRWRKRRQRRRLGVEAWATSGGHLPRLVASSSSDIKRHRVVASRWPSSNADQDDNETLYVSLSAEASSLGEGTSTSLLSLREVGSSSGEPLSTFPLSNEEEASSSDFETTALLTSSSNTSDPTVSTSTSVSATISSTRVVVSISSPSSRASSSDPLDTPTSSSAVVQPIITSAPSAIPSDTSKSSLPPSATTSSTSSRPLQSSFLPTGSASTMSATESFSGKFPSSTPASSIPRSASQTLRTTFILPDPSSSSEPPENSNSSSSWSDDSDTSYVPFSSTPSATSDIPYSSPTPSSQYGDDIFGQPSSTLSPSETLTTPTRTFTVTKVFTTTFSDGRTTTVSKVIETGVLRTDTPVQSNLSRTTGAIAGITVSVVIAAILIAILLFFGCKRYRSRRDARMGSIDTILARAREVWRPPLDGDDDDEGSYMRGYGATNPLTRRQTLGSQSQSGEDGYIGGGKGPGSSGDHLSGDGGHGSAESGNMRSVNAVSPSFGGQPYISGFAHNMEDTFPRPEPVAFPVYPSMENVNPDDANQYWWGINDPQVVEDGGDANHPGSGAGGRSAASLTVYGGSSSAGHGSTIEPVVKPNVAKRASLSGPRPMPPDKRRNSRSSPPSSFAVGTSPMRDSTFDCERQNQEQQTEKNTMIGLLNRLRRSSTHRMSTQSVATLKGSQESVVIPPFPSNLYSPSLLNPPTPIPPQTQAATIPFPRSVMGNKYPDPPMPSVSPEMSNYISRAASFPWPPITLPPPSPVLTDNSSLLAEGLLHPRLSSLATAGQASTASLRDHEDYTRPINGLVNNHLRSTTTFDTFDSDDGLVMGS